MISEFGTVCDDGCFLSSVPDLVQLSRLIAVGLFAENDPHFVRDIRR